MSQSVEGERTVSGVANKKVWLTPGRKAALIGVGTAMVIGFVYWKNPGAKKDDEAAPPPPAGMGQSVPYDPPKPQPMPAAFAPPRPPAPVPVAPTPQAAVAPPLPAPQPITALPGKAAGEAPRHVRMLSYSTDVAGDHGAVGAPGKAGVAGNDGTRVTYKGSEIVGAKAGAAVDMDLLLMPGVMMCVLDVAVDSTLPGPIMCHLQQPVLSPSGVTLMARGTQVIGSYTSEIKQGQGRLMAVTATAWTPEGVPVPLGGPFADGLGRSGLGDVNVDNKYPERFGAAVLMTLGEGALNIGQALASKSGNSYVSLSSGTGVSGLGQQVLQSSINIPPQITKNEGDIIGLWITAPIDFSSAYKLTGRSGQ